MGNAAGTSAEDSGQLKVFVSYSRKDVAFADQIVLALEDRGFVPIIDRHDIDPSEQWRDRLRNLIVSADAVIFVLTKVSSGSPICQYEVDLAHKLGKRIVPILPELLEDATPPEVLTNLNYIYFYSDATVPGSGFYAGLSGLVQALTIDINWVRALTKLLERANDWVETGRRQDRLPRGSDLKEAQEVITHKPAGQTVPSLIFEFLDAADQAEKEREALAAAQVEEREQALAAAEEAARQREALGRRMRVYALGAFAIGLVLTALAVAGLLLAKTSILNSNDLKSELFITAAEDFESDSVRKMLMALTGDPAADDLFIAPVFLPDGNLGVRSVLSNGYTGNRLAARYELEDINAESVAADPTGTFIVIGDESRLHLLNAHTGELIREFEVEDETYNTFYRITFLPDGKQFLTGDASGRIRLWSLDRTAMVAEFIGHEERINRIVVLPNATGFMSAADDGLAIEWSLASSQPVNTYRGENNYVTGLDVNSTGTLFVMSGDRHFAELWAIGGIEPIRNYGNEDQKHDDWIWSIIFLTDNDILTASDDNTLRRWDLDGYWRATYTGHDDYVTGVVPLGVDGDYFLTADAEGLIMLWDTYENTPIRRFEGHEDEIMDIAILPDESKLFSIDYQNTLMVWNLVETGLEKDFTIGSSDYVRTDLGLVDDKTLYLQRAGKVILVDLEQEQVIEEISLGTDDWGIYEISSPENRRVLFADGNGLLEIRDWGGAPVQRWTSAELSELWKYKFLPTGDGFLTAGYDRSLKLYRTGSAEAVREYDTEQLEDTQIAEMAISPYGKRFATIQNYGGVLLWSLEQSKPLGRVGDLERYYSDVMFLPGDRGVLLIAEGGIEHWQLNGDSPVLVYDTGNELIGTLKLFSDGMHFAAAFSNGQVMMWRLGSEVPQQVFDTGVFNLHTVDMNSKGNHLLTGTDDGRLLWLSIDDFVYQPVGEQIRRACQRLDEIGVTSFTEEEVRRFRVLRNRDHAPCDDILAGTGAASAE